MVDKKKYMKEYNKQYYQKNKTKLDTNVKKWLAENPEKEAEYGKRYRENNKEEISARQKQRRKKKWNTIRQQETDSRQRCVRNFLTRKLCNLKKGKRKRGRYLEFDIDLNLLMMFWERQDGRCAITGYEMKHEVNNPYSVSVDRIDSKKGYIEDNIQLVCSLINFAKNSWPNEIMIEFWSKRL